MSIQSLQQVANDNLTLFWGAVADKIRWKIAYDTNLYSNHPPFYR